MDVGCGDEVDLGLVTFFLGSEQIFEQSAYLSHAMAERQLVAPPGRSRMGGCFWQFHPDRLAIRIRLAWLWFFESVLSVRVHLFNVMSNLNTIYNAGVIFNYSLNIPCI